MKDFILLDEMLDKQKIHLNKAYEEGYKEGYKDGFDKGYVEVKTEIDKIRAEIESHICGCGLYNDGLDMAIKIIDKYIGDTE